MPKHYPYVDKSLNVRVVYDDGWWYHVKDCMKALGYSPCTIKRYRSKLHALSTGESRWLSVPGCGDHPHLYVNWAGFRALFLYGGGMNRENAFFLYTKFVYLARSAPPRWKNIELMPGAYWVDTPGA